MSLKDSIDEYLEQYRPIPVGLLRAGQQLPFDIYEERNVLLLRKGTHVTPRFLHNLKHRKLAYVYGRAAEVRQSMPLVPVGCSRAFQADLEVATADRGSAAARAIGGAGANASVSRVGCLGVPSEAGYATEMIRQMVDSRKQDAAALRATMAEVIRGSIAVSDDGITALTDRQLRNLTADRDVALNVCQMSHRDDYWAYHSLQMAVMGMALAAEMSLAEADVRLVGKAAFVHDLGMQRLPKELIESPRRLDRLEFLEIIKHPIVTLELIEKVAGIPNRCRLTIMQVHERSNGTGYPHNLSGESTLVTAKVLGLVDAYLALISDRPFRKAFLPHQAVLKILQCGRVGMWDRTVVRAFLSLIGLYPVGSMVMLSNGCLARVLRSGAKDFARPQVAIAYNADGVPQPSNQVIDLAQEGQHGLTIVAAVPVADSSLAQLCA